MSNCRSCHAEILWARVQASGKRIPLDPEPIHGGNLELLEKRAEKGRKVLVVRYAARPGGKPLYVSHHATCPWAKEWRKKTI